MLCYGGDSKDWWSCSWCALRICGSCRGGLERCPNRSIEAYVEQKQARLDYEEEFDEQDEESMLRNIPVLVKTSADIDHDGLVG